MCLLTFFTLSGEWDFPSSSQESTLSVILGLDSGILGPEDAKLLRPCDIGNHLGYLMLGASPELNLTMFGVSCDVKGVWEQCQAYDLTLVLSSHFFFTLKV